MFSSRVYGYSGRDGEDICYANDPAIFFVKNHKTKEDLMPIRTEYKFTLPKGIGVPVEEGRKPGGVMRLIKVKDLIQIERDGQVQQNTGAYYLVLLSKVIKELGKEKAVSRRSIERLCTADFIFLVDFLQFINHRVLAEVPTVCGSCRHRYKGALTPLGEA